MPRYTLTYFDFDGGRAEPVRIALHAGGIAFEDKRISFEEFAALRPTLRFCVVPTLEIDGVSVTQSNAICRYVGQLAGLYPRDPLQALYCDEVLGAVEDLSNAVLASFGLEGEALREAREALVAGPITTYLRGFDALLQRGGGEYFAGNALSVADLKLFVQVRSILSGRLDHIPTDIVGQLAPALLAHNERVATDPRVVAYYRR